MEFSSDHLQVGALAAIGDTPIVELSKVTESSGARVLIKLESANPTGSMKDRMAVEVIQSAVRDGRLKPGGLADSSLISTRAPVDFTILVSSTIGVLPIAARAPARRRSEDNSMNNYCSARQINQGCTTGHGSVSFCISLFITVLHAVTT